MPTWNELFTNELYVNRIPESEVNHFVDVLETLFSERPLRLWDVCCGGGRHTVAMAQRGHEVYASDNAPNALRLTQEWISSLNLEVHLELADMTVCPWPETDFHGAISWDSLYHNTLDNINKTVSEIHRHLLPGGFFMCTLMSTKSDSFVWGCGQKIEPGTFIRDDSCDAGVPHHFFDENEVRELFRDWEYLSLAEQVINYLERGKNFLDYNPFPFTKWGVLVRKMS
jgi:ubiquinone/menaquinone biosynthesis C-methylase UbiE